MPGDNSRDLDPSRNYSDDALPFTIYRVREWHKFPRIDLETGNNDDTSLTHFRLSEKIRSTWISLVKESGTLTGRQESVLDFPKQSNAFLETQDVIILQVVQDKFLHALCLIWGRDQWLKAHRYQTHVECQQLHRLSFKNLHLA